MVKGTATRFMAGANPIKSVLMLWCIGRGEVDEAMCPLKCASIVLLLKGVTKFDSRVYS